MMSSVSRQRSQDTLDNLIEKERNVRNELSNEEALSRFIITDVARDMRNCELARILGDDGRKAVVDATNNRIAEVLDRYRSGGPAFQESSQRAVISKEEDLSWTLIQRELRVLGLLRPRPNYSWITVAAMLAGLSGRTGFFPLSKPLNPDATPFIPGAK